MIERIKMKVSLCSRVYTKNKRIAHWLLAICLAVIGTFSFSGCSNTVDGGDALVQNEEVVQYDNGYRFDTNGWIYLHIEGSPYDRGYQHGYLMAPELKEILRSLEYLTYWETGMTWDYFVEAAEKLFVKFIDQEYIDEMRASLRVLKQPVWT